MYRGIVLPVAEIASIVVLDFWFLGLLKKSCKNVSKELLIFKKVYIKIPASVI
jgi:hypothetical protein